MPKLAGRFFIIACMSEKYKKPYCTPEDHVALLKSRGLNIEDEKKAISYLTNIGYFRLSAYFYPLLKVPKEEHIYKPGATFKKVLDMYRFGRFITCKNSFRSLFPIASFIYVNIFLAIQ